MTLRLLAPWFLLVLPAQAGDSGDHWAYQPLQPAAVAGAHPVDGLLGEARAAAGVSAAKLAAPRRWLERAAYTLTGLPPSAEQIRRIEENSDDATWAALVDELLASPAYGERWARHWMDVARYADTRGYAFDKDNRYPYAYTYRDWLIGAFNRDLPFERFIKLQIAADHLVDRQDHPDLAALGFLTVGLRGRDADTLDDRVDVVTRGFMATTVACARCHDHKSDPITMRDYYSLYSIFENAEEPAQRPVIGVPQDAEAFARFREEAGKLEAEDLAARQQLLDHLRDPAGLAVYLELAWQAQADGWDQGKATSECFKRGRFRPTAVLRWRAFLQQHSEGEQAAPRLLAWAAAMRAADAAGRVALCRELAGEWAAEGGSELAALRQRSDCPLAYSPSRMSELFDVEDTNKHRDRESAMSQLEAEHLGSPPRAMSVADARQWKPARTYLRGDPGNPGETFERQWLSFLGGEQFPKDRSARLSLAEKIADPANPLTARAWVNRVWAWQFGAPLADPGDFGIQQPEPRLRRLLDWLALEFIRSGGSTKQLQRTLLTSRAFRLESSGAAANAKVDEANETFWKWNRRRTDFEAMRDRVLATSGTLDLGQVGGRSLRLDDEGADRRRSVYGFVDRWALPGNLVSFDVPHPDHHSPGRVETTVPQQALFFLNSPLMVRQAAKLAGDPALAALHDPGARARWIYTRVLQRQPSAAELKLVTGWVAAADPADYQPRLTGNWEILHGEDNNGVAGELRPFPVFADGVWKTGKELASAPVPFLHGGPQSAHPAPAKVLVARWRALAAGEVQLVGELSRPAKQGKPLAWEIRAADGALLQAGTLGAPASATIAHPWVRVKAGEVVDFVLRAPAGANNGSVGWNLRILGREDPRAEPVVVGHLRDEFPTPDSKPNIATPGDPWADLIQLLWASNEFNYID